MYLYILCINNYNWALRLYTYIRIRIFLNTIISLRRSTNFLYDFLNFETAVSNFSVYNIFFQLFFIVITYFCNYIQKARISTIVRKSRGTQACKVAIKSSPTILSLKRTYPHLFYPSWPTCPIPRTNRSLPLYRENRGCSSGRRNCPCVPVALSPKIGVVFEGGGRRFCADCTLHRAYRTASIQKKRPPAMAFHLIPLSTPFFCLQPPSPRVYIVPMLRRCSSVYLRVFARARHAIRIMECIDDASCAFYGGSFDEVGWKGRFTENGVKRFIGALV